VRPTKCRLRFAEAPGPGGPGFLHRDSIVVAIVARSLTLLTVVWSWAGRPVARVGVGLVLGRDKTALARSCRIQTSSKRRASPTTARPECSQG
jgi:hypothetical protein